MGKASLPRRPVFASLAIVFCVMSLVLGLVVYDSGHGAGFQGWGAMVLGVTMMYAGVPVALLCGVISLLRSEKPVALAAFSAFFPSVWLVLLPFIQPG